jgi:lipopolysaccharide export system protein LptC
MQTSSFNWLPIVLLVGIGGFTFWMERAAQTEAAPKKSSAEGADFWAERFTLRRYGPDGKLQNTLTATQLTHESAGESSIVLTPKLVYAGDRHTTITAARAQLKKDGSRVELIQDVRIDRGAGATGNEPLTIRSEQMTIYPDQERAEGKVPVRIAQPKSIVSGGNFTSDNKTGISVLQGGVRATLQRSN